MRLFFGAALLACAGMAHAAPVLINGSLTGSIDNNGVPAGWTVTTPSPDTMDQNNNVGVIGLQGFGATPSASPDGGTWVGVAREGDFNESFGQTVAGFVVGTTYQVSWYHSNFGYDEGFAYTGANAVEVLLDGVAIGHGAVLGLGTSWVQEMLQFTATSASHRLDFHLWNTTKSYNGIDGIALNAVADTSDVPEPGSIVLLALGLAGLALARRQKQA